MAPLPQNQVPVAQAPVALCALSLTEGDEQVARVAGEWARALGFELTLVHCAEGPGADTSPDGSEAIQPAVEVLRERVHSRTEHDVHALEELRARAGLDPNVACEVLDGPVEHGLLAAAKARAAALIILGAGRAQTTGSALAQRLIGTTVGHLAGEAPCPVLVVPSSALGDSAVSEPAVSDPGQAVQLKGAHWVTGLDFSSHAQAALAMANKWSTDSGGQLTLVHVVSPPGGENKPYEAQRWSEALRQQQRKEAEQRLEASRVDYAPNAQVRQHVGFGRPADELCQAAQNLGADVLVIGTRGHTGLARLIFGSTARHALAHARIPILLVREEHSVA